jgi:hypothetical protein
MHYAPAPARARARAHTRTHGGHIFECDFASLRSLDGDRSGGRREALRRRRTTAAALQPGETQTLPLGSNDGLQRHVGRALLASRPAPPSLPGGVTSALHRWAASRRPAGGGRPAVGGPGPPLDASVRSCCARRSWGTGHGAPGTRHAHVRACASACVGRVMAGHISEPSNCGAQFGPRRPFDDQRFAFGHEETSRELFESS